MCCRSRLTVQCVVVIMCYAYNASVKPDLKVLAVFAMLLRNGACRVLLKAVA